MSDESGKTDAGGEVPRANPQHVEWLNEGVESWNRRRKEKPFKPLLTGFVVEEAPSDGRSIAIKRYIPISSLVDLSGLDLSGADLRRSNLGQKVFRGADFSDADLTEALGTRSDFSGASFRNAQLSGFVAPMANFRGANFRYATFYTTQAGGFRVPMSDFTDTDLSEYDLTGVDFSNSTLQGANLTDSKFDRTDLAYVNLTDAALERSRLWCAWLFESQRFDTDSASGKELKSSKLESLGDLSDLRGQLVDLYKNDVKRGRVAFYFRGEPCTRTSLRPTVIRHGLRPFERDLLTGLKTEFPAAFSGCEYAIDELAIARHYGLPTRLLDVTRNPMVGLYWATGGCGWQQPRSFGCEEIKGLRDCSCMCPHESCDGRLHVFAFPTELVRAYDSDRVSIVANFARLSLIHQEHLLTKRREDVEFKYIGSQSVAFAFGRASMDEAMRTLVHNVRREKPYFADQIDIRDLFRVFVVEPRRSFDRIRAQSGAFMFSAFHERFEGDQVARRLADTKLYDHHVLTIPYGKKDELREELDWFGISGQTLYADVESAADAVTRRFLELAESVDTPPIIPIVP